MADHIRLQRAELNELYIQRVSLTPLKRLCNCASVWAKITLLLQVVNPSSLNVLSWCSPFWQYCLTQTANLLACSICSMVCPGWNSVPSSQNHSRCYQALPRSSRSRPGHFVTYFHKSNSTAQVIHNNGISLFLTSQMLAVKMIWIKFPLKSFQKIYNDNANLPVIFQSHVSAQNHIQNASSTLDIGLNKTNKVKALLSKNVSITKMQSLCIRRPSRWFAHKPTGCNKLQFIFNVIHLTDEELRYNRSPIFLLFVWWL